MTPISKNIIFLTGAPDSSTLDWREQSLLESFLPSFAITTEASLDNLVSAATPGEIGRLIKSNPTSTTWRVVPLTRQHLATGLSQTPAFKLIEHLGSDGNLNNSEPSFCTISDVSSASPSGNDERPQSRDISFASTEDETLSEFYEHSYAVHEDIKSSQVAAEPADSNGDAEFDRSTFDSTIDPSETTLSSTDGSLLAQGLLKKPTFGRITDIKDIPNASYLRSIVPQTMTVNLIVGMISIGSRRTVQTRRAGRWMDLVEILVGDETRAGFGITFWLLPEPASNARQQHDVDLRGALFSLQPQDVVLLRNVGLSSFRGSVFGQGLRRGMTTIHLLHRSPGLGLYRLSELERPGEVDQALVKIKAVRDWVLNFVGVGPKPVALGDSNHGAGSHAQQAQGLPVDDLPPDTQ